VADAHIEMGGGVLRHAAGALDLRLETALDSCKAALLQARARRSAAVLRQPSEAA
jgi:flagellar biosynthesis/type III secretory pathway protein FliH